jgi:thioredoxin-like negative regulator of GroEL
MRLALAADDDLLTVGRAVDAESLVVVLPAGLQPAEAALARAMLELLAVERAPWARINAVLPATASDPADVDAAVAFLESATATTGQLLELS